VRLRAPAKINWTLEVLGKRSDGYHEIRTIMQTIDLADRITLSEADTISLSTTGVAGPLAEQPDQKNLAYRAAMLLGKEARRGVHIELEKRVPIAAGLGGGSSDAAAVLRGLRALWSLDIPGDILTSMAAELGSDVPFFLRGGTALASGRGELVEQLPDAPEQALAIAWPEGAPDANKTASMYATVRQEHYSKGERTEGLAKRLRAHERVREEDIHNVFEQVRKPGEASVQLTSKHGQVGSVGHLCGSGPGMYFLVASDEQAQIATLGLPLVLRMNAVGAHTIGSAESTTLEEIT